MSEQLRENIIWLTMEHIQIFKLSLTTLIFELQ